MSCDNEKRLFSILCCTGDDHTVASGGSHLNFVLLKKLARWPYLVMTDVLASVPQDLPLACALICDRCFEEYKEIRYALGGKPGPNNNLQFFRVPVSGLDDIHRLQSVGTG